MNPVTIVRLSFDCRTISYYLPRISQTLPMRRKAIVSSMTTKPRLQYRSRFGEVLEIYDATHRTTSQPGVTKALHICSMTASQYNKRATVL